MRNKYNSKVLAFTLALQNTVFGSTTSWDTELLETWTDACFANYTSKSLRFEFGSTSRGEEVWIHSIDRTRNLRMARAHSFDSLPKESDTSSRIYTGVIDGYEIKFAINAEGTLSIKKICNTAPDSNGILEIILRKDKPTKIIIEPTVKLDLSNGIRLAAAEIDIQGDISSSFAELSVSKSLMLNGRLTLNSAFIVQGTSADLYIKNGNLSAQDVILNNLNSLNLIDARIVAEGNIEGMVKSFSTHNSTLLSGNLLLPSLRRLELNRSRIVTSQKVKITSNQVILDNTTVDSGREVDFRVMDQSFLKNSTIESQHILRYVNALDPSASLPDDASYEDGRTFSLRLEGSSLKARNNLEVASYDLFLEEDSEKTSSLLGDNIRVGLGYNPFYGYDFTDLISASDSSRFPGRRRSPRLMNFGGRIGAKTSLSMRGKGSIFNEGDFTSNGMLMINADHGMLNQGLIVSDDDMELIFSQGDYHADFGRLISNDGHLSLKARHLSHKNQAVLQAVSADIDVENLWNVESTLETLAELNISSAFFENKGTVRCDRGRLIIGKSSNAFVETVEEIQRYFLRPNIFLKALQPAGAAPQDAPPASGQSAETESDRGTDASAEESSSSDSESHTARIKNPYEGEFVNVGGVVVGKSALAIKVSSRITNAPSVKGDTLSGIILSESGDLSLDSFGTIQNEFGGYIHAGGNIALSSRGRYILNRFGSRISSCGNLHLQSAQLLQESSKIVSEGEGRIHLDRMLSQDKGSHVQVARNLSVFVIRLVQRSSSLLQAGGQLTITANTPSSEKDAHIINSASSIISTDHRVEFIHSSGNGFRFIDNSDGGLFSGNLGITFPTDTIVDNRFGRLESLTDLTLSGAHLENENGRITAVGSLAIHVATGQSLFGKIVGNLHAGQFKLSLDAAIPLNLSDFLHRADLNLTIRELEISSPSATVMVRNGLTLPYTVKILTDRFMNSDELYIEGDLSIQARLILNAPESKDGHFGYGFREQDNFHQDLTVGPDISHLAFQELVVSDPSRPVKAAVIRSRGKMTLKAWLGASSVSSVIRLANREFETGSIDTSLGGLVSETESMDISAKYLVIGVPGHGIKTINLSHIDSALSSFTLALYTPNLSYISAGKNLSIRGIATSKLTMVNLMGIVRAAGVIETDNAALVLNYGGQILGGDGSSTIKTDRLFNVVGTRRHTSEGGKFIDYTMTPSSFFNVSGTLNITSPDVRNVGSFVHGANGLDIRGGKINGETAAHVGKLLNDSLSLIFNQSVLRCTTNVQSSSKRFAGIRYGSSSSVTHEWREHTIEASYATVGAALTSDTKVDLDFETLIQSGTVHAPKVFIITAAGSDFGRRDHLRFGDRFDIPESITPSDDEIEMFYNTVTDKAVTSKFNHPLIIADDSTGGIASDVSLLFDPKEYKRFIIQLLQKRARTGYVKDIWSNSLYSKLTEAGPSELSPALIPGIASTLNDDHDVIRSTLGQISGRPACGIAFVIKTFKGKKVLIPYIHLPKGSIPELISLPRGATVGDASLDIYVGGQLYISSAVMGGETSIRARDLTLETTTFKEKVKLSSSIRHRGGGFGRSYHNTSEWWDEVMHLNSPATLIATQGLSLDLEDTLRLNGAYISVGGAFEFSIPHTTAEPVVTSEAFDMPTGNAGGQSRGIRPVINPSSVMATIRLEGKGKTFELKASDVLSAGPMSILMDEMVKISDMGLAYTAERSVHQERRGPFRSTTASNTSTTHAVHRSTLGSIQSSAEVKANFIYNIASTFVAGGGNLRLKAQNVQQEVSVYRDSLDSRISSFGFLSGSRTHQQGFQNHASPPMVIVQNGSYHVEAEETILDESLCVAVDGGGIRYSSGEDIYINGRVVESELHSRTTSWGINNPVMDVALTAIEGDVRGALRQSLDMLPVYRHVANLGVKPHVSTAIKASVNTYNDLLGLVGGYAEGGVSGMLSAAVNLMNLAQVTLSVSRSTSHQHRRDVLSPIYDVRGSIYMSAGNRLRISDGVDMHSEGVQLYRGRNIDILPATQTENTSMWHSSASIGFNPLTMSVNIGCSESSGRSSYVVYRPTSFTSDNGGISFVTEEHLEMIHPAVSARNGEVKLEAASMTLEAKLDEHTQSSHSSGANFGTNAFSSNELRNSLGLSFSQGKSSSRTVGYRSHIDGQTVRLISHTPLHNRGISILPTSGKEGLIIDAPAYEFTPLKETRDQSGFSVGATFEVSSIRGLGQSLGQNVAAIGGGMLASRATEALGGSPDLASIVGTMASSNVSSRMIPKTDRREGASSGLSLGAEFSYTTNRGTVSAIAVNVNTASLQIDFEVFETAYDRFKESVLNVPTFYEFEENLYPVLEEPVSDFEGEAVTLEDLLGEPVEDMDSPALEESTEEDGKIDIGPSTRSSQSKGKTATVTLPSENVQTVLTSCEAEDTPGRPSVHEPFKDSLSYKILHFIHEEVFDGRNDDVTKYGNPTRTAFVAKELQKVMDVYTVNGRLSLPRGVDLDELMDDFSLEYDRNYPKDSLEDSLIKLNMWGEAVFAIFGGINSAKAVKYTYTALRTQGVRGFVSSAAGAFAEKYLKGSASEVVGDALYLAVEPILGETPAETFKMLTKYTFKKSAKTAAAKFGSKVEHTVKGKRTDLEQVMIYNINKSAARGTLRRNLKPVPEIEIRQPRAVSDTGIKVKKSGETFSLRHSWTQRMESRLTAYETEHIAITLPPHSLFPK